MASLLAMLRILVILALAGLPFAAAAVCPNYLGTGDTPGYATNVAVDGNLAYVADEASGLRVMNIADPAHPSEVGFFDTPGYANSVAVAGTFAYVADFESGLRIIDVSTPSSPSEAGFFAPTGKVADVAVSGNYAYLACEDAGFRVVNIGDPAHPVQAGFLDTPGKCHAVALSGSYAYLADWASGLRVLDIGDPASPREVGSLGGIGTASDIALYGDRAYIADFDLADPGLRIVDISDPAHPAEIGHFSSPQLASGVAGTGNLVFLANMDGGLRVVDVRDPGHCAEIGSYTTAGDAVAVCYSGFTVFLAAGSAGLQSFDWRDCQPQCQLSCAASATPPEGLAPLPVSFSASYTYDGGCVATPSYTWNFGDGQTSNEQNPSHSYSSAGIYQWSLTVTADSQTCTRTGTVIARASWLISGGVGISAPPAFFPLDGPSVLGITVWARNILTGEIFTVPASNASYSIGPVPEGDYEVWATASYQDYIAYGAKHQTYGCPAPGAPIVKEVSSAKAPVRVSAHMVVDVKFPPPVIFLHGSLSCYEEWHPSSQSVPDFGSYWDNAAREAGFVSFTPSYQWWGAESSWHKKADQVASQMAQDLGGLSASKPGGNIPSTLVAKDMGGLVARVLTSGPNQTDLPVAAIRSLCLLGTPNSGMAWELGQGSTPMDFSSVLNRFNEVYPDFGPITPLSYAIAGNRGLWGLGEDDGWVHLGSAFTVGRVACDGGSPPLCSTYPALVLAGRQTNIFSYNHWELGGPESKEAVLITKILAAGSAEVADGPGPDAPGSKSLIGTITRNVVAREGDIAGRSEADLAFPISATDGMVLRALVTAGSARVDVIDPAGKVAYSKELPETVAPGQETGASFVLVNPPPGVWVLRVVPTPGGASYAYTVLERSPAGISGYLDRNSCQGGTPVAVRMDTEGIAEGAVFSRTEALLKDASGAELFKLTLYDDGAHGDGAAGDGRYGATLDSPNIPGNYTVNFDVSGSFRGSTFLRTEVEELTVLSPAHWFTGRFEDSAYDEGGDGTPDGIRFEAEIQVPRAGSYAISGDLYDTEGAWVNHATAQVDVMTPELLTPALLFSLAGIKCPQLEKPFTVRGLSILDGVSLNPADAWTADIATASYAQAGFPCDAGAPAPSLTALLPGQGFRGGQVALSLGGKNIPEGSSFSLGGGITIKNLTRISQESLSFTAEIAPDAALGPRDLQLTPPAGDPVILQAAFQVVDRSAPTVKVMSPEAGAQVKGVVSVTVSARDEVAVRDVSLLVDGAKVSTLSAYPYTFSWDSSTASNGDHSLVAEATNDAGLVGQSAAVQVVVKNNLIPGDCDGSGSVSIGEVQKAINMFLGTLAPDCGVDCNGDGLVSIGELQKVINAFLGLPANC